MMADGNFIGIGSLAKTINFWPGYGADFEIEGTLGNEMLGLEKKNLDEVVAKIPEGRIELSKSCRRLVGTRKFENVEGSNLMLNNSVCPGPSFNSSFIPEILKMIRKEMVLRHFDSGLPPCLLAQSRHASI